MKEKLIALAKKLGLFSKMQSNKMTSEEWTTFSAEFKKAHDIDILAALEAAKKVPGLEEKHQAAIMALVNEPAPAASVASDPAPVAADPIPTASDPAPVASDPVPAPPVASNNVNVAAEIIGLREQIRAMGQNPEPAGGDPIPARNVSVTGRLHSATHLFGVDHPLYARSEWFNEVHATRVPTAVSLGNKETEEFSKVFNNYAESFASRVSFLQKNGLLGASVDYTGFDDTKWGEEFIVRRQDALISYLRDLPSVSKIFPIRYGVQNKMVMTNSFLTDFSQAYQSGEIWKGAFTPEPETAKVDDAMFKHKFENLKTLEKEYIGYLNREGSDPMKWSFVEWLLMETLRKLHNEQEVRRISGYRIDPTTGTAGHHMFAADGIERAIERYEADFKVLPFEDLKLYTSSTILAYVKSFIEYVNLLVPSLRGYSLYMNEKHIPWYMAAYRTAYGTHLDFKGAEGLKVMDFDIDSIIAVPNMGTSQKMWITIPKNIELYENVAGEMSKFYLERRLEALMVASWWKEGSGAYKSGRKYANKAAAVVAARKYQYIFTNDPFKQLADDATTCDANDYRVFKTLDNTNATAITDITNAVEGVVYHIICGGVATNASTIAKANKFSELSAAWIPTAIGDYLKVYYNATTSKFIEVENVITA